VAILSAFSLQLTNRQNKLRLFFSGKSFWLSLMFEGRISDEEKSFVTLTLIGLDRENHQDREAWMKYGTNFIKHFWCNLHFWRKKLVSYSIHCDAVL